jgi:hypothetical protein
MDEPRGPFAAVETAGLRVHVDRRWHAASLRYFEPRGPFAAEFLAWSGTELPAPQRAIAAKWRGQMSAFILAWRSPTETWAFSMDQLALDLLKERTARSSHGCCVDQSGGFWVLKATGERVGDLLLRIGSTASLPAIGEAHVSRVAEIPVLTMSVNPGETLMVVDRLLAEHLLSWIRITAADFDQVSRPASAASARR